VFSAIRVNCRSIVYPVAAASSCDPLWPRNARLSSSSSPHVKIHTAGAPRPQRTCFARCRRPRGLMLPDPQRRRRLDPFSARRSDTPAARKCVIISRVGGRGVRVVSRAPPSHADNLPFNGLTSIADGGGGSEWWRAAEWRCIDARAYRWSREVTRYRHHPAVIIVIDSILIIYGATVVVLVSSLRRTTANFVVSWFFWCVNGHTEQLYSPYIRYHQNTENEKLTIWND